MRKWEENKGEKWGKKERNKYEGLKRVGNEGKISRRRMMMRG